MKNLKSKVAIITGGTKGIGYGVAEALMREGINVAITSRTKEAAEEAAKQLNSIVKNGGEALGLEADVRDFDSQNKAVEAVVKKFGKIDVVIANAGLGHFGSVEDLSVEQWKETIDTNLSGVFYTLKTTLEQLKANEGY